MIPLEIAYNIVLARPQDVGRLAAIELAAAMLLKGHAPETVLNEVTPEERLCAAQRDGLLWVALADDAPVGFAHVELLEHGSAHLAEIDVDPVHGRRGLGTRLIGAVCKWAERNGYNQVTLTTFRDVPWNMPFYMREGFAEMSPDLITPVLRGVFEAEARRGLDPARRVVMSRRIGPT